VPQRNHKQKREALAAMSHLKGTSLSRKPHQPLLRLPAPKMEATSVPLTSLNDY